MQAFVVLRYLSFKVHNPLKSQYVPLPNHYVFFDLLSFVRSNTKGAV